MANSSYRSPFGIIGAVYAICVWVLTLVAIGGYQGNDGSDIITIIVIAVLLTIFYFAYSRKRQVLSPQEKRVLLVARDLV
ncbi:TPA: hypothetical protein N0F65_010679 [Lagenidium giganteum]|uniref:Uncharacterized protein n=1 Tax=Lagenidium giganteum TaxID=4803 RepID=A0AAV2Z8W7_9STRA|nr:TPA: hypothetical protein N0F65_010679 [Lagenidium giganteum]